MFSKRKSFLHLSSLQSWQTCIGQLLPNASQLSTTNQTIPTTPIIITINIIGTVITTISIVLRNTTTGIFTTIQQIKLPPLTTNTKTIFTPTPMGNSGICFNWWTFPTVDWLPVAIGRPFRPCGCTIMDAFVAPVVTEAIRQWMGLTSEFSFYDTFVPQRCCAAHDECYGRYNQNWADECGWFWVNSSPYTEFYGYECDASTGYEAECAADRNMPCEQFLCECDKQVADCLFAQQKPEMKKSCTE